MKKIIIMFVSCLVLVACTNNESVKDKPLKGEKEVIEMIKERIDFQTNDENIVEMYKRDGKMDKKVTIIGDGKQLIERMIASEVPYQIFNVDSKKEMQELLADDISQFKQVEGLHYAIDFFEAYYFEEIQIIYDELDVDQYALLEGNDISSAEKNRDFLYMIREYIEKGYKFFDE